MDKFDIGIPVDLHRLLQTRMLITAGSGAGKSYLIRKLLETFSGHVQQIIFDYEGEFVTLREKYPFALAAVRGGDIPLSIRYAGKLAETLMQTNLSVILDMYDLEPDDRILFMHEFIHSLMKLPRELYHPVLLYLDEIDVSCPQEGLTAASKDIRNLAARGRKKGLCIIPATQRLSKVHKDVAAECQNKLVGMHTLEIDVARAATEIGLKPADRGQLRELDPGHFLAYGPALTRQVQTFKVAPVITTHVEAGTLVAAPPVPDAIRNIVCQLKDLPEEAEKDLETIDQLKAEVARLRAENANQQKTPKPAPAGVINAAQLQQAVDRVADKVRTETVNHFGAVIRQKDALIESLQAMIKKLQTSHARIRELAAEIVMPQIPLPPLAAGTLSVQKVAENDKKSTSDAKKSPSNDNILPSGDKSLGKCARAILSFLASHPKRDFTKIQIGVATGYSITSSGFQNSMSELSTRQLIIRGPRIKANPAAAKLIVELVGGVKPQIFDQNTFKKQLGKCELEIYDILLRQPHSTFTKEDLASRTPSKYSPTSSGFQNSLSRLSSLELLVRDSGLIRLNPEILALINH